MDERFEDLDDEDIEYLDEDFISEEDMEEEVGDIAEVFALPFSSIFVNKIPDKLNPGKFFKDKELILYNPNDRIQPYNKIEPSMLTYDMLKTNLIVSSIRFEQNSSLEEFAAYAKILNKGLKPIINNYVEFEKSKEPENKVQPENGFKNSFKPKPKGAVQSRNMRVNKNRK